MNKPKANIKRSSRFIFGLALFIGSAILCYEKANAQIGFLFGANLSTIQSNVSINKEMILGAHFGLSVQYYPFKKWENVSIINELNITQKGYRQVLDKKYLFRFSYLSFPFLVNYSFLKKLSVQLGFELNQLIVTNIEQGTKTYNNFDLGVVLGVGYSPSKVLHFHLRFSHGVLPMIDYYEFDALGNFKKEIHDIRNVCLSLGMKFNFYNAKILLYE